MTQSNILQLALELTLKEGQDGLFFISANVAGQPRNIDTDMLISYLFYSDEPTLYGMLVPQHDGWIDVTVDELLRLFSSTGHPYVQFAGAANEDEEVLTAIREAAGESIHAWIGPSVCGSCYEVPAEMAAAAAEVMPGIESHTSWGTPSLDLPGAAAMLLEGLGVDVTATGVCTVEDRNYYSYRRDARTGRLAGIVWPAPLLERNR